MENTGASRFDDNRDIFAFVREIGLLSEGSLPVDMNSAYEITKDAWEHALNNGGPFGIADPLGPQVTLSILSGSLAEVLIDGWMAGTILSLSQKSADTQRIVLDDKIKVTELAGKVIKPRDIAATNKWIVAGFAQYRHCGNIESVIQDSRRVIHGYLSDNKMFGDVDKMVGLAAAFLLVAGHAAFPNDPPRELHLEPEGVIVINGNVGNGSVIGSTISGNSGSIGGNANQNHLNSSHESDNVPRSQDSINWAKWGAIATGLGALIAAITMFI